MKREVSIAFQTDKTASEYRGLAGLVNRYRFDAVSVYCDAPHHPSYGPLLLMAPFLTKARIGPAAVSPFRIHPIDIAANTALLAELTNERVYIGLARGAWLSENGIEEPAKPIQAMREAIKIIHALLSGEIVDFDGEVYHLHQVCAPYPLPDGKIQLMIGTWGKKLAMLAGEYADEVKIGGSANPAMARYLRQYIQAGADGAGRSVEDVGIVLGAVTVVDKDRELARRMARSQVAVYLPVVLPLDPTIEVDSDLISRINSCVAAKDFASAGGLISDDLLDLFAFSGSPSDIIDQVNQAYETGVDRIEFGTPHGVNSREGIQLLGSKVLPGLNFSN